MCRISCAIYSVIRKHASINLCKGSGSRSSCLIWEFAHPGMPPRRRSRPTESLRAPCRHLTPESIARASPARRTTLSWSPTPEARLTQRRDAKRLRARTVVGGWLNGLCVVLVNSVSRKLAVWQLRTLTPIAKK